MYKYLFGPLLSRRLGVSLGVDLVTHKVCSLDCVYCECGRTTELTFERKEYVPYVEVVAEIDHYFANHPSPDYITFSGAGEPTLNSRIGDVIEHIKNIKSDISIAVLTNGTLLSDPAVRESLLKADLVIPSLDAASLSEFQKINKPHPQINLNGYIQGIADFRKIYKGRLALEVFILPEFNDNFDALETLKDSCYKINPDVIQLNTLDRPGTILNLTPASSETLEEIKAFLESGYNKYKTEDALNSEFSQSDPACNPKQSQSQNRSIQVEIIASSNKLKETTKSYRKDIESAIIETINRRPCTSEDLASILGSRISYINSYLFTLEKSGKIISVVQERGKFYHIKRL